MLTLASHQRGGLIAVNFRQLRYFIHIVEHGSFGKASAILRIAQPALSHQIRNLEDELGVQLLIRHTSGVVPTEAGATLNEHAKGILRQVEVARKATIDQADTVSGTVALGLTPSLCEQFGAAIVARVRALFPEVSVMLAEGLSVDLQEWVLRGRIDFAWLHNPQPTKLTAATLLFEEDLVLVAKAGDERLPETIESMADVADLPMVMPALPNSLTKLLLDAVAKEGKELAIAFHINTSAAILELVASGVGYTVLPYLAVKRRVDTGELRICPAKRGGLQRTLFLLWSNQRPVTRAMAVTKSCVEALVQEFDHSTGMTRLVVDRATAVDGATEI